MGAVCYGRAMVARPLWSLAIHGGAGTMAREAMTRADQSEYEAGLAAALEAGAAVLAGGGGDRADHGEEPGPPCPRGDGARPARVPRRSGGRSLRAGARARGRRSCL